MANPMFRRMVESSTEDPRMYFYWLRPTLEEISAARTKHPREYTLLLRMIAQKMPKTRQATIMETYTKHLVSSDENEPLVPAEEFKRMTYSMGLPSYVENFRGGNAKEAKIAHAFARAKSAPMPEWYMPSAIDKKYLRYLFDYLANAQTSSIATTRVLAATLATTLAADRDRRMVLTEAAATFNDSAEVALRIASEMRDVLNRSTRFSTDLIRSVLDTITELEQTESMTKKAKDTLFNLSKELRSVLPEDRESHVGGSIEFGSINELNDKLISLRMTLSAAIQRTKMMAINNDKPIVNVSAADVATVVELIKVFVNQERIKIVMVEPDPEIVNSINVGDVVDAATHEAKIPESAATPPPPPPTAPKQSAIERVRAIVKARKAAGILGVDDNEDVKNKPAPTRIIASLGTMASVVGKTEEKPAIAGAESEDAASDMVSNNLIVVLKERQAALRRIRVADFANKNNCTMEEAEQRLYAHEYESETRSVKADLLKEQYKAEAEARRKKLEAIAKEKDDKISRYLAEKRHYANLTRDQREAYNKKKREELDEERRQANVILRARIAANKSTKRYAAGVVPTRKDIIMDRALARRSAVLDQQISAPRTTPLTGTTNIPALMQESHTTVSDDRPSERVSVMDIINKLGGRGSRPPSRPSSPMLSATIAPAALDLALKQIAVVQEMAKSAGADPFMMDANSLVSHNDIGEPTIAIPEGIRQLIATTASEDNESPTGADEKAGWLDWVMDQADLKTEEMNNLIVRMTANVSDKVAMAMAEKWEDVAVGAPLAHAHKKKKRCCICGEPAFMRCHTCKSSLYCKRPECYHHYETIHRSVCAGITIE